jgi:arabinofuranan 3-O-arabinosyltransferase
VLAGRPVVLNGDAPQVHASAAVVTDSLRRRVRNFGEIRDDYSPTLAAGQPLKTFEAVADFTEPGWLRYEAVATYTGIQNVWASSSDSDIDAVPNQSGTGLLPFAAVDGNLKTMWESGGKSGPVGQWIRIKFDATLDFRRIRVAFADNRAIGPPVRRVQVRTQSGSLTEQVRATSGYQVLRVPRGPTNWLRVKVLAVRGAPKPGSQVAIEEISVPGVHAGRTIEAPDVRLPGGGDPAAVELAKAEPQPTACMLTSVRWVCSPGLATPTEEQYGFNESFTVPRPSPASLSGSAVLTNPGLIQRYAYAGDQVTVSASSTYTSDPQDQPYAAFDASEQTAWISGAADPRPRLTIRWRDPTLLSTITVLRPPGADAVLPMQITGSAGQVRSAILGGPGSPGRDVVRFAPMRTSGLTLTFSASHGDRPVQISDVEIPGVPQLAALPTAPLRLGCGSGPDLRVDGRAVATRVVGTVGDILDSQPLSFTACSAVSMEAGRNTVVESATDAFSVQAVTLARPGALVVSGPAPTAKAAKVLTWTPSRRVLQVAVSQPSYLIVNENFNAGWGAILQGQKLQAVRLDGWKQGWLLPAGARGVVTLTYQPDAQYRAALFAGLAALGLILLVAAVPLRRRQMPVPVTPVPLSSGPLSSGPVSSGPLSSGPVSPGPVTAAPESAVPATDGQPAVIEAWVPSLAVLLAGLLGLWTGGYVGMILLPAMTLGFLVAVAWRSRLARVLAEPWLVFGILAVAAVCGAVSNELYAHGIGGAPLVVLGGVVPELACLAIVGRVIAAVLASDAR